MIRRWLNMHPFVFFRKNKINLSLAESPWTKNSTLHPALCSCHLLSHLCSRSFSVDASLTSLVLLRYATLHYSEAPARMQATLLGWADVLMTSVRQGLGGGETELSISAALQTLPPLWNPDIAYDSAAKRLRSIRYIVTQYFWMASAVAPQTPKRHLYSKFYKSKKPHEEKSTASKGKCSFFSSTWGVLLFWWIPLKLAQQIGRIDISVCFVCDLVSPKGVVSRGDIFLRGKKDRTALQA